MTKRIRAAGSARWRAVRRLAVVLAAIVTISFGCGKTAGDEGSESNFVHCDNNSDCDKLGPEYACIANQCAIVARMSSRDGGLSMDSAMGSGGATSSPGSGSGGTGGEAMISPDSSAGTAGGIATDATLASDAPSSSAIACSGASYISPDLYAPCDETICSNARCVPESVLAPGTADAYLPCDTSMVCIPDFAIQTSGQFRFQPCRSTGDIEGRCLSTCYAVTRLSYYEYAQDLCADGEVCVPCWDPASGMTTGVCEGICDVGPVEPTPTPEPCCGGAGGCVAPNLLSPSVAATLGSDSCTTGTLCLVVSGGQGGPCTDGGL